MSQLEIVDLNYCETATKKKLEVSGGFWERYKLPLSNSIRSLEIFDLLDSYEETEVYSNSDTLIKKLENSETGDFGYQIINQDGTSGFLTLTRVDSSSITAMAISYSGIAH